MTIKNPSEYNVFTMINQWLFFQCPKGLPFNITVPSLCILLLESTAISQVTERQTTALTNESDSLQFIKQLGQTKQRLHPSFVYPLQSRFFLFYFKFKTVCVNFMEFEKLHKHNVVLWLKGIYYTVLLSIKHTMQCQCDRMWNVSNNNSLRMLLRGVY